MAKKKATKVEKEEVKIEENIIEKYTNKETKQFNFGLALLELEKELKQAQVAIQDRDLIIGKQESRIRSLEDGMTFFANEWESKFEKSIIMPTNSEINLFKK